jgi:hypothetical protein
MNESVEPATDLFHAILYCGAPANEPTAIAVRVQTLVAPVPDVTFHRSEHQSVAPVVTVAGEAAR